MDTRNTPTTSTTMAQTQRSSTMARRHRHSRPLALALALTLALAVCLLLVDSSAGTHKQWRGALTIGVDAQETGGSTGTTGGETISDASSTGAGSISSGIDSSGTASESTGSSGSGTAGESSGSSGDTGTSAIDNSSGSDDSSSSGGTGGSEFESSSSGSDAATGGDTTGGEIESSSGGGDSGGDGGSSTGSVEPDPDPVDPPVEAAPTARWFVSRRDGADTPDCGLSAAAPCQTPRFAYYYRITEYSYPAVADAPDGSTRLVDPVLLVHAFGDADAYDCDDDPEGGVMWIYSSLTVAAYTIDSAPAPDGSLSVRTTLDADAATINSVAAAMAHQLQRFQTEVAPLQRDDNEPAEGAPLRRIALPDERGPLVGPSNSTSAIPFASFDCAHRGRAFFVYNGALVRFVGIEVVRGNSSRSTGVETAMGGAVLVHGPAALLVERSSFSHNSARDGGEPVSADAVHGDERGGAIALLNTPFFAAVDSTFVSNAATLGGALHFWQYTPVVDASILGLELTGAMAPLSSFAWLDRCTLEDNEATVDGGAVSSSFVLVVPDPPPATPDGMVLRGVAVALTRSLVRRNRVAGPLVERKGGALSLIGIFFAQSWIVLAGNLFASNTVAELHGASLAVLDTLDHGSGGAVSIWMRGSFVSSSLLLAANRFLGNRAPLKGGGVFIESRAQQGLLLWAGSNHFERNLVRNQAHTSSGGALLVHYGPRIDAATCVTGAATTPLGPGAGGALIATCDPAAAPSPLYNRFLLDSNVFLRNKAQGFGGALNLFYQGGYSWMDMGLATQRVGALLENVPFVPVRNASALVFDPSTFAGEPGGPDQGEGRSTAYPADELRIMGATVFHSNAVFVNASLGPVLGLGGAALLKLDADEVMPLSYDFVAERLHFLSYAFRTRVTIVNASFVNNSASTPVPEEDESAGSVLAATDAATASTDSCGNCFGGGVFMQRGVLELVGCHFHGNRASGFGGALYLDRESTRLRARGTLFSGNRAAVGGQAIYSLSAASHVLQQSVIDMHAGSEQTAGQAANAQAAAAAAYGNLVPHLLSPTGGQIYFFNSTLLVCPAGFSLRNDSIQSYRGSDTSGDGGGVFVGMLLSSRSYSCEPCAPNTWSLGRGMGVDDAWEPKRSRLTCAPCPFGADCAGGINDIKAREGVWGSPRLGSSATLTAAVNDELATTAVDSTLPANMSVSTQIAAYARLHRSASPELGAATDLSFHVCPEGYCCEAGRVCPLDYCSNHRTGVLCSKCESGYTFVLGSSSCRPQSSCGSDSSIFWPLTMIGTCLVSLALLALRLYALLQGEAAGGHGELAADVAPAVAMATGGAEDKFGGMHSGALVGAASEPALPPMLLLRVLLFYFQLFGMVIPSASSTATHAFAVWVSAIATFQFSNQLASDPQNPSAASSGGAGGGVCVQPHLSGWAKISYGYLFPSLVVLWLLLWTGVYALLRRYRNEWLQRSMARVQALVQSKSKTGAADGGAAATKAGHAASVPSSSSAPVHSGDVELQDVSGGGSDSDKFSVGVHGIAGARGGLASQDANADAAVSPSPSAKSVPSSLSCPCHPSSSSSGSDSSSWSLSCVLAGVGVDLLLTCYTAFLKTTASLVTCVSMDGQSRLFQAADVRCYTPAQGFALFVLVAISALPLLLASLPRLYPCVCVVGPGLQRYRRSCAGWYESVLMVRRLVFVLLSVFIVSDAYLRALLLLFLCVASTFVHQALHPFRQRAANALESACLAALTCACAISMRAATLQDAQASDAQADGGGMAAAMERLQLVLLVAPPALAVLLFVRATRRTRANRAAALAAAARARQIEEEEEVAQSAASASGVRAGSSSDGLHARHAAAAPHLVDPELAHHHEEDHVDDSAAL